MKKKATYSAPSMTIIELETRDIICESGGQKNVVTVTGPEVGGWIDFSDETTSPDGYNSTNEQ